jgi:hypothetical protein
MSRSGLEIYVELMVGKFEKFGLEGTRAKAVGKSSLFCMLEAISLLKS